jgi:hypothetical protein
MPLASSDGTPPAVPYTWNRSFERSWCSLNQVSVPRAPSLSAGTGGLEPRTTMALSRLAPMTAPSPERPWKCLSWFTMAAKRTPRSPATPVCSTRTRLSPSSFSSPSCTSPESWPQ